MLHTCKGSRRPDDPVSQTRHCVRHGARLSVHPATYAHARGDTVRRACSCTSVENIPASFATTLENAAFVAVRVVRRGACVRAYVVAK